MLKPVQTYPSALLKGTTRARRASRGGDGFTALYRRPPVRREVCGLWSCRCLSNRGHSPRLPSETAADPERARRGTDDGLGKGSRGEGLRGRGEGTAR